MVWDIMGYYGRQRDCLVKRRDYKNLRAIVQVIAVTKAARGIPLLGFGCLSFVPDMFQTSIDSISGWASVSDSLVFRHFLIIAPDGL